MLFTISTIFFAVPKFHLQKQMSTQYGTLAQDVSYSSTENTRLSRAPSTMSKNFNRFSSFVKHGGEDYILGKAAARVKQTDQVIHIG